jgi:hypothetical protein
MASEWTRGLTPLQRAHRGLSLWFGSAYQHPDGKLELDFEAPAGINPDDSEEIQRAKLARYEQRKHEGELARGRAAGALLIGFVVYKVAHRSEVLSPDAIGLGLMVAFGLYMLSRR